MGKKRVLLAYTGTYWTHAELKARVRALGDPDTEVPSTLKITAEPEVLDFAIGEGGKGTLARVTVKEGVQFPADDRVRIHVSADPAAEAAGDLVMASMNPVPGLKLPGPFPNLTADVEALVFPYKVDYAAIAPDDSQQAVASGGTVGVDADGRGRVRVQARVQRVDSGGAPLGPVSITSASLVGATANEAVAVENFAVADGGLRFEVVSKKLLLEAAGAGSLKLAFKLSVPSGRRFTQRLTLEPRPLTAAFQILPVGAKARVGRSETEARAELVLTTEGSRPVSGVAWLVEATIGSFLPGTGSTDAQGRGCGAFVSPTEEQADAVVGPWPVISEAVARVGPDKVEAGRATLLVERGQDLKLTVSKAGFETLRDHQVKVVGTGAIKVKLVTVAKGELVPVAHATVSSAGLPSAQTDGDGECVLASQGASSAAGREPVTVTLPLSTEVKDLQKTFHDHYEKVSGRGLPNDLNVDYDDFIEVDYVKRLAREPGTELAETNKVVMQLLSIIKVADMSRGCLQRNFARYQGYVKAFFANVFASIWDLWLGDKVAKLAGALLKAMGNFIAYLAKPLTNSRPGTWVLSGVHSTAQGVVSWARKMVEKVLQKVRSQSGSARIRDKLRERLQVNAVEGPFKPPDGKLVKGLRAPADKAVKAVKGQISRAQASLAAAERELDELVRLKQPPAALEAAKQRIGQAKEHLRTAEESLTKTITQRDSIVSTASLLDDILSAVAKLFNLAYNLLTAVLLAIVTSFILAMGSIIRGDKAGGVLLEHLSARFMDLLGDQLSPRAGEAMGGPDGALNALKADLLAQQLALSAFALTEGLERSKGWIPVDRENFREAVSYYYNWVERATFESESNEIWMEFYGTMVDWLEWIVIWMSRVGALITAIIATIGSAGLAAPEVWAFNLAVNEALELFHKVYGVLKVSITGKMMSFNLATVVRTVVPSQVRYLKHMYDDWSLDSKAVSYMTSFQPGVSGGAR